MRQKLLLPLLACAFISTSAFAQSPPVTYSLWMKWCLKDGSGTTCLTGRDSRTICGLIASATIIDKGDATATFRVGLAPKVDRNQPVRFAIDQEQPIVRPYKECNAQFCTADYQASSDELVRKLKSGRMITVQGADSNNRNLVGELPLAGFAEAYEGPPTEPKVFEYRDVSTSEQREQRRRDTEAQRQALEEARKRAGC